MTRPEQDKEALFQQQKQKTAKKQIFINSAYLPLIVAGCNTRILKQFPDEILCDVTRLRNKALHAEPETMRYMSKSALFSEEPSVKAK